MLIPIILIEILPFHQSILTLKVLFEFNMQILPILQIFLIGYNYPQSWIPTLIIFYSFHQPDDILLIIGQLGTYYSIDIRYEIDILLITPSQLGHP